MNLDRLFEMQRKLDERIVKEKRLQDVDLLDKKILALQVELGELANEWRGFKFWSEDQKPRTLLYLWEDALGTKFQAHFNPRDINESVCGEVRKVRPLLEEYCDCLHFILSIGLELGVKENDLAFINTMTQEDITLTFVDLFTVSSDLLTHHRQGDVIRSMTIYDIMITTFLHLGELLGFTWDQMEQAYYEKNKVNHERQENGY